MEQAPAWVSYASAAIAVVALLVSMATYRRAGPRVRVDAAAPKNWRGPKDDLEITVTARNTGLAPVQVSSIRLALDYVGLDAFIPTLNLTNADCREGSPLKFTLEGNHEEVWKFDALAAMRRQFGDDYKGFSLAEPTPLLIVKSFILMFRSFLSIFTTNFRFVGIVAVADLGNGIQVTSAPLYRLTYALYKHEVKRQKERDAEVEAAELVGGEDK